MGHVLRAWFYDRPTPPMQCNSPIVNYMTARCYNGLTSGLYAGYWWSRVGETAGTSLDASGASVSPATYTKTLCTNGCTNPAGGTDLYHTETRIFYNNATPPGICSTAAYSQSRTCGSGITGDDTNTLGTLNGGAAFNLTSCQSGCQDPTGGSSHLIKAEARTYYLSQNPGGICNTLGTYSEVRTCAPGPIGSWGVVPGSMVQTTCTSGCTNPGTGATDSNSTNTTLYSTTTPAGLCSSFSQTKMCGGGTLNLLGSYGFGVGFTNTGCTSGCNDLNSGYMSSSTVWDRQIRSFKGVPTTVKISSLN